MNVIADIERKKPVMGIVLGDPAGIGPELVAKVVADGFLEKECRPIIIGDRRVLDMGMKIAGVSFSITEIAEPRDADFSKGIQIIDTKDFDPTGLRMGEIDKACGKAAGDWLVRAMELYKQGGIQGIVFAPLNKAAMKIAGYNYESEHALFAKQFEVTTPYCEVNVLNGLMTSRVTSHIPIKDVSELLTKQSVLDAIYLLDRTLKKSGVAKPRLGVAALNPHCGENGTCGREEIDVIAPAVEEARAKGVNALGPFSGDTLFVRAFDGEFDAAVTMYHDQGQIALKVKGFQYGVTVAGGIPAPIATPAHGTAFDIAGKNLANPDAMKSAVALTARMATHWNAV